MIPKIEFVYSKMYDDRYRNNRNIQKILKRRKIKYPSPKKISNYVIKINKIWGKYEKTILKELERITKLKWKENKIKCYVVGQAIPFSDPLTIPIYKNITQFIDVLIHELIHQLFTQSGNMKKSEDAWNYVYIKYKKESFKTKIHIPLHAIHKYIYLKYFSGQRLSRDIKDCKHRIDYKLSWKIVQKEGYEKIINEWRKRIR